MRRALTLLAALALGAALPGAHATTAPTLTLAQQARKADVIVRATLGSPTNVTEGEATWLVYPLTVTETVAGDPASLPQREGRPVLYLLQGLEDLPELRAGEQAFLLLYSRRMDNPIVGFAQGVYPVVNGRVTRPGESAGPVAPAPTTPPGAGGAAATPGTAPSSTAPGSGTATTPPPTSGAGPTAATPPAGSTPASGSGTAPPTTAPGATTPATTPGAGAATSTPAAGSTPTPPTATAPVNDPNAFPSDPARFRDALRAARETR